MDKELHARQDFGMQTVILAGGLGTRMRPLTEKIPKSMIEIKGRPFLEYQMRFLLDQGLDEILMLTGFHSDLIENYVAKQSYKDKVKILSEGETLRGTGGALLWAAKQGALKNNFFVLYGDSFLPIDFREVETAFKKGTTPALMTVLQNEGEWDKSNVIFDKGVLELYDKNAEARPSVMKYIDYGLLALAKNCVESWVTKGQEKFDMADQLTALSKLKKLAGFEVFDRFYEIGSFDGLKDFEQLVGQPPWREFFDFKKSPV